MALTAAYLTWTLVRAYVSSVTLSSVGCLFTVAFARRVDREYDIHGIQSKVLLIFMSSAGIPDPSVPKPMKIRSGATPGEIRAVAIGIVVALLLFTVYTIGVSIFIRTLTIEQVNIAAQMIVQLDSFLTAGWIVGFFYYWGNWEEALRASKRARKDLRSKTFMKAFDTAEHATLHQAMLAQEKEMAPTAKLFIEIVLGVVMFILSGIAAVNAVLTYTLLSVQLALEFMVGGVLVMIISWVLLRYITQKLRELTDLVLLDSAG